MAAIDAGDLEEESKAMLVRACVRLDGVSRSTPKMSMFKGKPGILMDFDGFWRVPFCQQARINM